MERALKGWSRNECEDQLAHIMTMLIHNRSLLALHGATPKKLVGASMKVGEGA